MRKSVLVILIIFVFISLGWGQRYPHPVLPGGKYTVQPANDTLWIITDSQLEQALIAAKELRNADLQIKNYQQQIDNLTKQLQQRDSIIALTKKNRDYYEKNWKECSENLKILVQENQREASKLKTAKILGGVATIAAFILGAYIF